MKYGRPIEFYPLDKEIQSMYLHCRYIEGWNMKTRIQKWGNSLALRIPKSFADEMGWGQNSSVQLMIKEGVLVVVTDAEPKWMLEELLSRVTEDNIHHEWETGPSKGDEIW